MQQSPTSESPSVWHVLGAGAMGCLWAASLAGAGQRVRVLLRDAPAEASETDIRLQGFDDSTQQIRVSIDGAAETTPIHRLLACTKAPALLPALGRIAGRIAPGAAVVLLQNGMGFHARVAALLPQARIFCALTTEGAFRNGPFDVRHAGRGETLLGAWKPADSSGTDALCRELSSGFLDVRPAADIHTALWRKLAVNCAINPLTALHGCTNGELLTQDAFRGEFDAVCAELAAIVRALGHAEIAASLPADAARVASATAANRSSMRQDLEAGRETEIGFITGFLCAEARAAGVACPLNASLFDRVRMREREPRRT